MSVVPSKPLEKVQFYENHNAPWSASAVAIGTTAAAVTDLATKTSAARDAYTAQQAAIDAQKAATLAYTSAVNAMAAAGAAIISQVRAKAKTAGDGVYVLAQIPAPATPAPVAPPGTATNFEVELNGDGSLMLTWKCLNPAGATGTIYQIYRRVGMSGEFTYLGGTGTKDFEDATVPGGATCLTYQIQAVRSTAVGMWAQFVVNFGTNSSGGPTIASVEAAPKLAA